MLTIIQNPEAITPAYNPMNYVVSSDNIAEPSFQYVFDVYVNGIMISRHRLPPVLNLNVGRLDVSNIVKNFLTHDIDYSATAFDRNPNSWVEVYVSLGEEYLVDDVLTTYIDLLETDTCIAVNASLEYLEYVDWSDNTFFKGTTRKFLTNIQEPKVLLSNKLWLYFYHEIPENIESCTINTYSSSGTLINTDSFIPTDLSNSEVGDRFLRVSIGPDQLKALFGSDFFDGASYYNVAIEDSTSSFQFEEKRINIQEDKCKYVNNAIHFLNKMGGFDVFNFNLVSVKNTQIERKKYGNRQGSFNSSNEFVYSISDTDSTVMSLSSQDTIVVNSDWITESESVWLKELFTSPVVYLEHSLGFVPIMITDNKYKTDKKVNEKLFNAQLSYGFGSKNFRQSY